VVPNGGNELMAARIRQLRRHDRHRPRWQLLAIAVVFATTSIGADVAQSGPAAADTVHRCDPAPGATCTVWMDQWIPNSPGRRRPGPNEDIPDGDEFVPCIIPRHWRTHWDQSLLPVYFPEAPDGSVLIYLHCLRDVDNMEVDWWRFDYVPPDSPRLPTPTPQGNAQWLWVGVRTLLNDPAIASDPAPGEPVTVDVPTFVEDTTWQRPIWLQDCRFGACVTLRATPTLAYEPFRPNEGPGFVSVECGQSAGSRFNPDSELTPEQQADGACAYTYTLRTGVEGRPDAWHGRLVVTWHVTWEAGAQSGEFDDIVLSVDIPRQVQELQANVVDADLE
jgi:hypothetical protein